MSDPASRVSLTMASAKRLDRDRLRHLLTLALLALEGPDDATVRQAMKALWKATLAK